MQSINCCLEGCESYKYLSKQKIGYFKFPINNKPLLKKWLNQIRTPNWNPSDHHHICSTHFHVDDIDFTKKVPKLKNNAIPMIFPLKHFQNIYVNEMSAISSRELSRTDSDSNKIQCKETVGLPTSTKVVLLCTPTTQNTNISKIHTDRLNSNLAIKKVPLKKCSSEVNPNQDLKQPILDPYILIVSDNREPETSFKKIPVKKKPAILKIQIEKRINAISSQESKMNFSIKQNEYNENKSTGSDAVKKRTMEEVEIDDVSSTKIVVFEFNSTTGEIKVVKKEKFRNENELPKEKSENSIMTNNLKYI